MSRCTLTALFCAVVFIGVLEFKPVHDTDIFWQVRLGQIMLDEGRIPLCDRFTYTRPGEPAPPIGWLAQVLFATIHGTGGWHLARAVHNLALVGALVMAVATCRREAASPFSAVVAMTIGFVVLLSNADLRPQSFGLLSFAAILLLARSELSRGITFVIAAPLLVAWQNMHPSVMVGLVALAGLAAADFLDHDPDHRDPWKMVVLAVLAMAAQFATPVGYRIFDVSNANLQISRDILHLAEWMPPWDPIVFRAVEVYWLIFPGSLIAVVWLWDRLSARDRALFIVMTVLSVCAARFILFWAVALVPLWAEITEHIIPGGMFAWARGRGQRPVRAGRSILGLAVALAIVLALHPARFRPIVSSEIPLDGVMALHELLPASARIYNDYIWAGPLLLDGRRGWEVAVDGRLYFFRDPQQWRAIEDARAGRIPLEDLERTHRPDAFFLHNGDSQALIDSLASSPRWRACFLGPTCAAFVRAR